MCWGRGCCGGGGGGGGCGCSDGEGCRNRHPDAALCRNECQHGPEAHGTVRYRSQILIVYPWVTGTLSTVT